MEMFIWLYSGATTGWWCYDDEHNITINKMYLKHCKKKIKNNKTLKKKENIYDKMGNIQTKNKFDETTELVDFESENFYENSPSFTNLNDDDIIKKFNIKIDYKNNDDILKISGKLYKIDFDKMLQINFEDIKKRRCIMCLQISEKIFNNPIQLKKYLINHKVKGVGGKLF